MLTGMTLPGDVRVNNWCAIVVRWLDAWARVLRSLEMVHTTTLLATRTPHTTVDISHDNVRTEEVES